MWKMHLVSKYENRRMKTVEIVLRRWGGRKRKTDGGGKSS
jgi:hypothetical protein